MSYIDPVANSAAARRYDIDAVRVLAFAILIFYHSSMFYVQDWGWHVKSLYQAEWLQVPMIFFNQWRMSLLFVVSGMATWFLYNKFGTRYLASRFSTIGIPLLFGMFVVVVPQAYFEAKANGAFDGSFLQFWALYAGINVWPEDAFAGSDFGITWNHLWYLPYLLFYSLAIVPMAWLVQRYKSSLQSGLDRLPLFAWYAIPMLPLMLIGYYVYPAFPFIDHSLFGDWYAHAMYFTFFALGYLLMASKQVWQKLSQYRFVLLVGAVVSFAVFSTLNWGLPDDPHWALERTLFLAVYSNRWLWILTILAMAYTYLNRPMAWVQYGTGAVFCWYILHQTITVSAGALLSPYQLGPILEPILVIGATIVGCAVGYHYIVRPMPWLHRLFGVKLKTNKPASPTPAGDASLANKTKVLKAN